MKSFEKTIQVESEDLDDMRHVNNVRYVQWIQDISKEHWEALAPQKVRDHYVWVVMEHHITYRNAARLGDTIVIKTYVSESHGATSTRIVEMRNAEDGRLLVKGATTWCFLHSDSLRPARIGREIQMLFTTDRPVD